MKFKLITFDFTGTLMRFKHPPGIQYESVAKMYGIEVPNKNLFNNEFRTAFKAVSKEHPNFGASTNLPWTEWWLQVVRQTFINAGVQDKPKLNSVAWHLIKLYGTTEGWELIPGVETVLQKLSAKGQRMGIISNIDPRIEGLLKEAGIRHHFEFVLPSYEAKCFKPDPAIFKLALEKYSLVNTDPSDCCHIGDSYIEDFVGATESGWSSILIGESGETGVDTQFSCRNIIELNERL